MNVVDLIKNYGDKTVVKEVSFEIMNIGGKPLTIYY